LLAGIRANNMVELATLQVEAPVRQFDPPAVRTRVKAYAGELARLVRYNLEGGIFGLVWQALSETPVSYSVFVHLSHPYGRVGAQHDRIPAGYSWPTIGRVKGESSWTPTLCGSPATCRQGLPPVRWPARARQRRGFRPAQMIAAYPWEAWPGHRRAINPATCWQLSEQPGRMLDKTGYLPL